MCSVVKGEVKTAADVTIDKKESYVIAILYI